MEHDLALREGLAITSRSLRRKAHGYRKLNGTDSDLAHAKAEAYEEAAEQIDIMLDQYALPVDA